MTPRGRGFTLLEVTLAAVLGSIVVLAAVSMFASLDGAQKMGEEAFDESMSAAMTHDVVSKALQGVMMSNSVPPPRNAAGERVRPGAEDEPVDAPLDPRDFELPRMILEADESQPALMEDGASQNGEFMRPQRLEVTLRARPLFVFGIEREESIEELSLVRPLTEPDAGDARSVAGDDATTTPSGADDRAGDDRRAGAPPESARDRSRRRREEREAERNNARGSGAGRADEPGGRSSPSRDREEGDAAGGIASGSGGAGVTVEFVQGVRGAFEFEFDPGVAAGGLEPQPGWVLWWRQIYPVIEAPVDRDPGPGQRVGATRLMGNIASGAWTVLYTKRTGSGQGGEAERLREHSAVWSDDLPGYVELDILSNTGVHHQWTFEIGWGTSGEPGSVLTTTGAPAAAGGANAGLNNLGTQRNAADRARTPTATDSGASGTSGTRRSGSSSSGSRGSNRSTGGGSQERR